MASTGAKAVRRADVLQRLSRRLGYKPVDLHANARGDAEMAAILTLERIADAVEERHGQTEDKHKARIAELEAQVEALTAQLKQYEPGDEQPPVTVETVVEKPLETVETVEIKPTGKAKGKETKDAK